MLINGFRYNSKRLLSAAGATGAGSALDTVQSPTIASSRAVFNVTGTFVATVTFEGSFDGTNFVTIQAQNVAGGAAATTTTTTGVFYIDCKGLKSVRPNVTAYTSGSVTVDGRAVG